MTVIRINNDQYAVVVGGSVVAAYNTATKVCFTRKPEYNKEGYTNKVDPDLDFKLFVETFAK